MAEKKHALHDIRIASPCKVKWETMTGDERVRHCGKCRANVYNLSAMTETEAAEIVQETSGNLCVSLWRRRDGKIMFNDCRVAAVERMKNWRLFGMSMAFVGMFLTFIYGITHSMGGSMHPSRAQLEDMQKRLNEMEAAQKAAEGNSDAEGGMRTE